jgi:hypothetical protein
LRKVLLRRLLARLVPQACRRRLVLVRLLVVPRRLLLLIRRLLLLRLLLLRLRLRPPLALHVARADGCRRKAQLHRWRAPPLARALASLSLRTVGPAR